MGENMKYNLMATKTLLRYYKWIDANMKSYEKYAIICNM